MASDPSQSIGLSSAQAQLLITLLREQSQSAMASSLLNDTASGVSNAGQDTSFSTLLSSAMSAISSPLDTAACLTASSAGPSSLWSSIPSSQILSGSSAPLAWNAGEGSGQPIAMIATQLAADLRGPNNRSFDASKTPTLAQSVWNSPGWGNGNLQCVAFVDGVYRQAGIQLPVAPNATDFWSAYANRPGWSATPNGQGLPQPGDIIVMRGGEQGFGHVAIVTDVAPPRNSQPGEVTIAQSNSPTSQTSLTINPDGIVTSWPGYPIKGFIHPTS